MQSSALFSTKRKRKKRKRRGGGYESRDSKWHDEWDIAVEEGREVIQQWRKKRLRDRNPYPEFLIYSVSIDTLKSFIQNINFMVIIQMVFAAMAVYVFKTFNITFDIHVSLLVSPIVFPLAFSINCDFQRREKVLEDLALFKSSGLVWYFCMREWKQAAGLDNAWMTAVHYKLKSLLFHLEEYLLTEKIDHRKVILRAIYEDFSDTNQIIERVRASPLPANTAIISRSLHLFNMMCLAFERLRVIREYRSPRSIRSFNKVFIMFLPVLLAPYFVYQGIKSKNEWGPYYVAVMVAFVFSVLQGVQDKLDNPFDGMSEDDINLNTIDEWTLASLDHTMKRTFDVGRFKVTVDPKKDPLDRAAPKTPTGVITPTLRRDSEKDEVADGVDYQKLAPILEGLSGNSRITKKRGSLFDEVSSSRRGSCKNNILGLREEHQVDVQKLAPWLDGVAGDTRVSWKHGSKIDLNVSPYASRESSPVGSPSLRPRKLGTLVNHDHVHRTRSTPIPTQSPFNQTKSNNLKAHPLTKDYTTAHRHSEAAGLNSDREEIKTNSPRLIPQPLDGVTRQLNWQQYSVANPVDSVESLREQVDWARNEILNDDNQESKIDLRKPNFMNIFKEPTTAAVTPNRFLFKPVVNVTPFDNDNSSNTSLIPRNKGQKDIVQSHTQMECKRNSLLNNDNRISDLEYGEEQLLK